MQIVGAEGVSYRRRVEPDGIHENRWFVGRSVAEVSPGPQAFTVGMMLDGMRLPPHFHEVSQFQLFFDGGGILGKDPIGPMTVFYTDAYASYGPIVAGEHGLTFYTLRGEHDPGLHALPEERGQLKPSVGRRLAVTFDASAPRNLADTTVPGLLRRELGEEQDDGMRIEFVVAGPETSLAPVFDDLPTNVYVAVLDGAVVADAQVLTRGALMFNGDIAERSEVSTADRGAMLAVMIFPQRASAPRQRRARAASN